jgi:hypothetical protein
MDRICIDGFPRSGNTFSQQLLTKAFPETWVTHFTHSAKILTEKHFVLIREPNVTISSFMGVFQEPNKEASERWWLRFHNTVLDKTNPERWIFFEDLINKTEQTVERIGSIVGVKPMKIDYSDLNKNSARESYPLYSFDKAQELYTKLKQKGQK